jgi:hypothetical protein
VALQDIASDSTEEKKTNAEANGLIKKMESLEFALLSIQNPLERCFNKIQFCQQIGAGYRCKSLDRNYPHLFIEIFRAIAKG